MLSLAELQLKNKDEVDVELYNRYSRLPPVSVTKVFDGYRSLKTALEEKRVFSKDRADANSNIVGGCVVLDAVFPPTYGKSSLGIGLTEAEKLERYALREIPRTHGIPAVYMHYEPCIVIINVFICWCGSVHRATMLNTWMAALLARYAQCTPEAQAAIQTFLALDEDNPAEPLNQTIHAVYVSSHLALILWFAVCSCDFSCHFSEKCRRALLLSTFVFLSAIWIASIMSILMIPFAF